jgi:hypothetical protein
VKAGLGCLLGLAALARLDTVFLLIAIVPFGFLRSRQRMGLIKNGRTWSESRRGFILRLWSNLWPLVLTTLVVTPYLLWNWSKFGHLQPVSGAIKSSFPHPRLHLEYLRQFPEFTILLLLGAVFFAASLRRGASRIVHVLGLFGLAGILHMVYTVLFLGGWQGPGAVEIPILGFFYFGIKTMIVYFVFILFRGSLPRFRIDQMMALNWKILTPIALVILSLTAIIEKLFEFATPLVRNLALIGVNILVVAIVVLVSRKPLVNRREKIELFAEENRAMAQKILGE